MAQTNPRTYSISTKNWSHSTLLQQGIRFKPAPRVSVQDLDLSERIKQYETDGIPLVVEHWHLHEAWPPYFDIDWVMANLGDDFIKARNLWDRSDKTLSLKDFIDQCRDQSRSSETNQELLYGKDVNCPDNWKQWLHGDALPEMLRPEGTNDLIQHLDDKESVESIMCYLGIRDTFTPAHKDLCASSGHNLMCHTEDGGTSFWFMTASNSAPEVDAYFSNQIGKELDWEDHVASVEDFAKAPFTVYIVEQALGDLVLVPPRSCHQVVNYGGLTIKTSWSRMTVNNLSTALYHELPMYRRVCRPEQYRIKHILYRSLVYYTNQLQPGSIAKTAGKDMLSMAHKLKTLLSLFDHTLREEFTEDYKLLKHLNEKIPKTRVPSFLVDTRPHNVAGRSHSSHPIIRSTDNTSNLACDFCGADIFQSFFECLTCSDEHKGTDKEIGNGIIICPSCYVEGRTCRCRSMEPVQCRDFDKLLAARNDAAEILKNNPYFDPVLDRLSPNQILSSSEVFIFQAACVLHQQRQKFAHKAAEKRKCRHSSQAQSHDASYDGVISCAPCHSSQCFRHLLQKGIHCSEAILIQKNSDDVWHKFHMSARQERVKHDGEEIKAAETGTKPMCFGHRLAILANKFGKCKPLSDWVTIGFYDTSPEGLAIDDVTPDTSEHSLEVDQMLLQDSSISNSPDIPLLTLEKDDSSDGYQPPGSRSTSHKRRSVSTATSQPNKRAKTAPRDRPKEASNLADVLNAQRARARETLASSSRPSKRVIESSSGEDEPISVKPRPLTVSVPPRKSKIVSHPAPKPISRRPSATINVPDEVKSPSTNKAAAKRRGPPGIRTIDMLFDKEADEEEEEAIRTEPEEAPKVSKAKRRTTRPELSASLQGSPLTMLPPPTVDLAPLWNELARMKDEYAQAKKESAQLKKESAEMKKEFAQMRKESAQMKEQESRTNPGMARMKAELARMEGDVALLNEKHDTLERTVEAEKTLYNSSRHAFSLTADSLTTKVVSHQTRVDELAMHLGNIERIVKAQPAISAPPRTPAQGNLLGLYGTPELEQAVSELEKRITERISSEAEARTEEMTKGLLKILSDHGMTVDAFTYLDKSDKYGQILTLVDCVLKHVLPPQNQPYRPFNQRYGANQYGTQGAGPSNAVPHQHVNGRGNSTRQYQSRYNNNNRQNNQIPYDSNKNFNYSQRGYNYPSQNHPQNLLQRIDPGSPERPQRGNDQHPQNQHGQWNESHPRSRTTHQGRLRPYPDRHQPPQEHPPSHYESSPDRSNEKRHRKSRFTDRSPSVDSREEDDYHEEEEPRRNSKDWSRRKGKATSTPTTPPRTQDEDDVGYDTSPAPDRSDRAPSC